MDTNKMKEFTLRISQGNRTQLVLITYEILLNYIEDAKKLFLSEQRSELRDSIRKAQKCLKVLKNSLDMKYEISFELLELYLYLNKILAVALIKNSVEELEIVEKIVGKLYSSFEKISKEDESTPIMKNSQQIYAGLTYGKGYLEEVSGKEENNRGFLV